LTAWAQVGGGGFTMPFNPFRELTGSDSGNPPTPPPTPPEAPPITTTTTSWVAMNLRNMDELMLQINLLRNQRFNTTLNDTDIIVLNNRVYPFAWQNGMFTRLPFPNNVTFYDCDGIKPEIARVVTPLKNRFVVRPINPGQMSCSLHLRVIENNHYEGKYTRTVLEFTSPCLDFPVYKYIMNKTGLRQNLRLQILGVGLTFQFRGVSFLQGRTRIQAYQEYRLLKPHHHPMIVPNQKYKRDNITASRAFFRGNQLSPTQQMALQAESLMLLKENYEKQMGIFNATEQAEGYKSRNEMFPRKARQTPDKPAKGTKIHSRKTKGGEKKASAMGHGIFRWPPAAIRKTQKILQKMVGAHNFSKLRKELWKKMQQDIVMKMTAEKKEPGSGRKNQKVRRRALRRRSKGPRERKLARNHPRADNIGFSPQSLNLSRSKERRLQETRSGLKRSRRSSSVHSRRLQMWHHDPAVLISARLTINHILMNEPYKVETCQRICTAEAYYPSWNFCLRVCGIKYNFLSNIHDDTSSLNLYSRVPFIKIAGERVFVHSGLPQNAQFTFDQIQLLKNSEDVRTCEKTWRTFRCQWSV
jgi:hypothetical protein